MAFAPKPGCPMCSIVSSGTSAQSPQSSSGSTPTPEILWRDDNFTIYRERTYPVSSKGHIIIVFNLHVPSLYTLSSSDLPLLVELRDLARRCLTSLTSEGPSAEPPQTPISAGKNSQLLPSDPQSPILASDDNFRIGFITPPFRDSKIPITDHLHAHAYAMPANLMGWWRSVGYSPIAWYAVDDLIAEIREESSNNRVRSGPNRRRGPRPIDYVPSAGARSGTANGIETTEAGLATVDLEDPERNLGVSLRAPSSPPEASSSSSSRAPSRRLTVDTSGAGYSPVSGSAHNSPTRTDGEDTPTVVTLLSPHSQYLSEQVLAPSS